MGCLFVLRWKAISHPDPINITLSALSFQAWRGEYREVFWTRVQERTLDVLFHIKRDLVKIWLHWNAKRSRGRTNQIFAELGKKACLFCQVLMARVQAVIEYMITQWAALKQKSLELAASWNPHSCTRLRFPHSHLLFHAASIMWKDCIQE